MIDYDKLVLGFAFAASPFPNFLHDPIMVAYERALEAELLDQALDRKRCERAIDAQQYPFIATFLFGLWFIVEPKNYRTTIFLLFVYNFQVCATIFNISQFRFFVAFWLFFLLLEAKFLEG